MSRRILPWIVAVTLLLGGGFSSSASALEPTGMFGYRAHHQPANCVPTPWGHSAGIPSPDRYPCAAPCGGWQGYGFGVPTYSWGWFGAKYRPAVSCFHGYYNDFYQWGYRRGY